MKYLLMLVLVLFVLAGCGEGTPPKPEAAPAVPPLLVADFNTCTNTTNLDSGVGAAYSPPDFLQETFIKADEGGCYARLDYSIEQWAALYILLPNVDMTPYRQLSFDIMAEPGAGISRPKVILELKTPDGEVSAFEVGGIDTKWQTRTVRLEEFGPRFGKPISSWSEISELVVVVEKANAGREGTILIDNFTFR